MDATPADIIYRALTSEREFSNRPFNLVLVGCNAGINLGFDIWHSGTAGAAMVAAKGLGVCAMAFSQDLPEGVKPEALVRERHFFRAADKIIPNFLRTHGPDAGACYNVNIPETADRGYKVANPAHYSYHRTPPTSIVPRAKNDGSDVDLLLKGYVTISSLEPRANPSMMY